MLNINLFSFFFKLSKVFLVVKYGKVTFYVGCYRKHLQNGCLQKNISVEEAPFENRIFEKNGICTKCI